MKGDDSDRCLRFKPYDESLGFNYASDQWFNDVAATRRVYLEQGELMGGLYQKARKVDQVYADYLYELWVTGKDDTQNLLNVMGILASQTPGPTPPTPPDPGQNVWNVPGTVMCFKDGKYGTYKKDGVCGLFRLDGSPLWQGQAESVFDILGDLFTLENGPDICTTAGSIYHHPSWTLMLYLIEHNGVTFSNGCAYGVGRKDAGVLRSTNKQVWQPHWNNNVGYMLWRPCIHNGLLTYAASGGNTDWGEGSYPAIWQDGRIIYEDKGRMGEGFWASASYQGKLYLGGSGKARVLCLDDGSDRDFGGEVIHWMEVNGDSLYIAVSMPSGAEVWKLQGAWSLVRKLDFPSVLDGSFEPDGLYLCGGDFGKWGRIVKI